MLKNSELYLRFSMQDITSHWKIVKLESYTTIIREVIPSLPVAYTDSSNIKRLVILNKYNIVSIGFFAKPFKNSLEFIIEPASERLEKDLVLIPDEIFEDYNIKNTTGLLRTDIFIQA